MKHSIKEWTKQNLWNTAFKKFGLIWSVLTDHSTPNFLKAVFLKLYFQILSNIPH